MSFPIVQCSKASYSGAKMKEKRIGQDTRNDERSEPLSGQWKNVRQQCTAGGHRDGVARREGGDKLGQVDTGPGKYTHDSWLARNGWFEEGDAASS
jgi:hypothetical protein